jgi:ubiquinone/menaquinone biosynthesis C-methylase UbiE
VSAHINELLICPSCATKLLEVSTGLECPSCGRSYPVEDGVPRLLLTPSPAAGQRPPGLAGRALGSLVAIPFVYDLVQRLAGVEKIFGRIRPLLGQAEGGVVLDAGAGTGNLESLLPESARYIWLDSDPQKLHGFRRKSRAPALLADATRIPLGDRSVDWVLSAFVSHHLDDGQLAQMLDEFLRVAKDRLLFLDAVVAPTRKSRLLWRYDRGRHPRSADRLLEELRARFGIESQEQFTILHRYLLVNARVTPRAYQRSR